ncbi:MAG: electron transfer flavoprotein subunit alpha/FixB family protein [Acidobacteria bacterium]|nr:electron transfer flavoprotein subunit alpha/FixB family protein [Acidobacteriota bacterium]
MSVLLIAERGHKMSWEALAAAQQLAGALGADVKVAAVGAGVGDYADELAAAKVAEVLAVDHELLGAYTPDGFTVALAQVIEQEKPAVVLFPHTYQVRDYAPKLATRLGKAFLSDATAMRVEDGRPVFVRQLFQGKMNADVVAEGDGPVFASVQASAYRADAVEKGEAKAPVRAVAVTLDPSEIRTKPLEPFQETKGGVDLTAAERIVSVGRGIQGPENLPVAEKLAAALGAEIAGSRPVIDNGWLPLERQVGSSGQVVSPKLYLALGISGAIQHVVGMKGAQTIVAVNKDESAPIFEIADYGIVGDLFEVAPALTEELGKG